MNLLIPLVIVTPLVVAALIAAVGRHVPSPVPDLLAGVTAAAVSGMAVALAIRSRDRTLVYWFGDWHPTHGFAPGIAFDVDFLSAVEAALAGVVVLAALVFSWRYFEGVRYLFHTLTLIFLAGMVGFALSGDLFNIFVFFELMSVSGYALCAYRVEQPSVEQGALNFAILNGLGAFSLLMGIGIIYGRTGSLNLDDIGTRLGGHNALTATALALITAGFLVKAGAAPFHFWLSDAYAVAATPVAAMFTAVMSELAFHVYARVRTTVFAHALVPNRASAALLVLALLSAVLGALMCLLQADTKRQIAFLTISGAGVVLVGTALSSPSGLAGAIRYVLAGGLLRGSLMLGLGVVISRLGGCDELRLHGSGRDEKLLGAVLGLGAIGLAAPPGSAAFSALATVFDAAIESRLTWICPVLAATSALCAGTLLRAVGRIFLGWGPTHDGLLTTQPDDAAQEEPTPGDQGAARGSWTLLPAVGLLLIGIFLAFIPGEYALGAARASYEPADQAQVILHGADPRIASVPTPAIAPAAYAYALAAFIGAFSVAAAALWWQRTGLRRLLHRRIAMGPIDLLKGLHSGSVGDYAAWFATGLAGLALGWMLALH